MRKKCLIWGTGGDYQKLYNLIKFEELKGNISIEAIVSKDFFCPRYDGYDVISLTEVPQKKFDYIIVASSKYYNEIVADAEKLLGNIREKIVDGRVMNIPGFDFGEYIKLRENPVSIIASDCLGGIIYHYLDLKFSSPFINCLIQDNDFLLLVNNLEEYMKQPLLPEYGREGDIYQCPIGTLTYLRNKVRIIFNHAYNFDEARSGFEKRRKRINWDNIVVFSHTSSKEYVENFDKISYRKKNFTKEDFGTRDSIMMQSYKYEYDKRQKDAAQMRELGSYLHNMNNFIKEINIFQMILGEHEVIRSR